MPTILELFRGAGLDKQVKSDKLTKIEQEVTGIRFKSLVEVNNPLLYGTDTIRIASRTTKMKDGMVEARNVGADGGTDSTGGKIQELTKKVGDSNFAKKVKNKFNNFKESKVGKFIGTPPGDLNPSSIAGELSKLDNVQFGYPQALSDLKGDLGGTGLLQSGLPTGNPKTAAQQAAGKLLDEAKGRLRESLFGTPAGLGINKTTNNSEIDTRKFYNPTGENKLGYSNEALDNDLRKETDSTEGEFGILKKYKSDEFKQGQIRVGKGYKGKRGTKADGSSDPITPIEGVAAPPKGTISFATASEDRFSANNNQLISDRGFTNTGDVINQSGIYDGGTGTETEVKYTLDEKDFIPLYFRSIVTGETVHFRGTITGLAENISPGWSSGRFSGNPFSFHTYESIERSVNFNFTIYPMNSAELANNWSKIEFLTSLTYPLGNPNIQGKSAYQSGQIGSVRAPVIYFTMGDLYKDKVCFIDSLQYTIPDTSNWQLDGTQKDYESSGDFFNNNGSEKVDVDKGYKLPHLVEVAITLKFIEQRNNTEDRTKLYSFKSLTYGN